MFEITEKILASLNAKPMTYNEVGKLPYLKFISSFGIDWSIRELYLKGYIKDKKDNGKIVNRFQATREGRQYLREHGYLN